MGGNVIELELVKQYDEIVENRDKEKIAEMLTRGKTVEAIADFCGYPIDLVREVEQSLLVTQ